MAIGSAINTLTSIATGSYLTIRPPSGVEWIIHNILVADTADVELYISDGTNEERVLSTTGGFLDYHFHATNSIYYKVKNISGTTEYIGYDGIVSKGA